MAANLNEIGILVRREIEARMVAPFIGALVKELGKERALRVTQDIIESLSREAGVQLSASMGGNSIAHFVESLKFWTKENALEIEVLEQTGSTFSFNVKRCRYAEMYKELGLHDLGRFLSCSRDFALAEGFNPKMKLTRTQTIMDGAATCDFRYRLEE
jgi:hypothetical protein